MIQLDAEIIPNESLGGLTLRSRLYDLQDLIAGFGAWGNVSFHLTTPFEARYRLAGGAIELAVDVRNGKVFKLSAYSGYKGTLFGKITVGMQVREAMKLEPQLYYDETEELLRCYGVPGLAIDVPEVDPPVELVPTMVISGISVYAEETKTFQGQSGDW